ncbi:MAG TPA: hypothetical protein P5571_00675 [Candidatus Krumholzibacteria bacterium]|nr:hypothetical protein [Candidatus Krumholzibacteria bacterium]
MRLHLLLLLGLLAAVPAGAAPRSCRVRYVSADHVYLDAGRAEGLREGLAVTVRRDGRDLVTLTVAFAAEHSASCVLPAGADAPAAGDEVRFDAAADAPEPVPAPQAAPPPTRTRAVEQRSRTAEPTRDPLRLAGSVAFQWDHIDDTSEADLDFDQPGLRINLRLQGLAAGWTARLRGSLRHDRRSSAFGDVPREEWQRRLWEASFANLGSADAWQFAVGRVGSRATAAVGPFDGALVNRRLNGAWRLGLFSGLVPDRAEAGWADDRLSGVVASLETGTRRDGRLDLSIAGVTRRRAGEVDRDYLALAGTWSRDRLSLTQSAQIDWNRGWRGDAGGSTLALSNVLLAARYRPDDRWRLSLSLDRREMVRTWTTRSLPDSLFADSARRGLRAGVTWRSGRASLGVDGGLRRDDRLDATTTSYGLHGDLRDWPARGLGVGADLRGFDGPRATGSTPSLTLSHRTRAGHATRVRAGLRRYELTGFDRTATGRWLSLTHDRTLGRAWSVAAEARWDGGDDAVGRRWFLELRRRI